MVASDAMNGAPTVMLRRTVPLLPQAPSLVADRIKNCTAGVGEQTMSKYILAMCALILNGCSAPAPKGADAQSAPRIDYVQASGPYNFDCDAQHDDSEQMNIPSPRGMLRIKGSFQVLTDRGVFHTYPFVTIGLVSPDSDSGVRLAAVVTNSDIIRFSFGRGTPLDAEFAKEAFTSAKIPFELTVDQTGKVGGSIDDIPLPGGRRTDGIERLRLTCSTAHVRFSNIAVETPIAGSARFLDAHPTLAQPSR